MSAINHKSRMIKRKADAHGLDAMSIDDLLELRDRVSEAVKARLDVERLALEERLERLYGAESEQSDGPRPSPLKGRKVAPKYRNPENPLQTWAGRGQRPSWMTNAISHGATISDFEIGPQQGLKSPGGHPGQENSRA